MRLIIIIIFFLCTGEAFVAISECVSSTKSVRPQTISCARTQKGDQEEENSLRESILISEKYSKDQVEHEGLRVFDLVTDAKKPPLIQQSNSQISMIRTLNTIVMISLGSYATSIGLGEMLSHFEWFQSFRYLWPFSIGCLFVFEGTQGGLLPFRVAAGSVEKWVAVIGGLGLMIGGAYDAFMPVWSTGPNVFTHAGLNQDSAAILLLLSVYWVFGRETRSSQAEKENSNDELALQMLLLGQLYKLGEGTFDEILSNLDLIP